MRRAFSFCAEYERRISFTSGKKVNIQFDTCGLDDFYVFVLNIRKLDDIKFFETSSSVPNERFQT